MLSLVQKQLLGFLSSRSISKMRPAKYIFSVWSALVTALLHQHSVPKAIQEGQLLITLPLSAHETLLRLSTLYPVTLVALWCHLSHPAAPLQYPMPSSLWYNLCEHTSLLPRPKIQKIHCKDEVILMIKGIQPTTSAPDTTFYILWSDWNTRSAQISECSKTNVQIHLRKLQTTVFHNQTRQCWWQTQLTKHIRDRKAVPCSLLSIQEIIIPLLTSTSDNVNREQMLCYWQSSLLFEVTAAWHNML